MKKYLLPFVICVLFASCDKKSKVEKEVEKIPMSVKVERFDKIFYETPAAELNKVKLKYPYLFPSATPDAVWIEKMNNPLNRELYTEIQKKYPNFEKVNNELDELFRHMKYYFPETKSPKVITLISEMDYQNKAIYADSLVLISLDLYLGKNHKFYEFPDYLRQNFETSQIMPDIVSSFAAGKIAPPTDKTLLSYMIYSGKELYLKDILLPEMSDADRIGYTPEQIKWCEENEAYMWSYFIEGKLLYDSDSKLPNRFINVAPFSKFYLEIDNESPGRVGTWVGWQIVRSFMKNNEVSLQDLLRMDAVELFNKSKYKPQK
ncbi:gliding motility lipoprotein GldB [Flavobacterium sp. GT3R68]|uniref:gliding motility lipoprotein GldB n=1 Tax=Flavobacterium sp. GT3R68 TaxID=2594437 RepID=UPI000F879487|nr:gliding motility lipoprotein GldB [Flavobacterium sp. GT3R68]RTY90902.1 gliding motility lipoprotein GldB [Flavobacterium sp. GSN2]TRW90465.1 gliding motility lipoprotein GldB [Flavobacterium sp. GT3R68]